jgi:hypothetical protein
MTESDWATSYANSLAVFLNGFAAGWEVVIDTAFGLTGSGEQAVDLVGSPAAKPQELTLAHLLEDNGFLLCRYTRKDQ